MKKVKRESFNNAAQFLKKESRPLERTIFEYYFENGSVLKIIEELTKFQNDDGGVAGLFEPDCRLPLSTPLASSMALRIINKFSLDKESLDIKEKIYKYLDASYDENRKGWFAVRKEINDYPHAPWWDFDYSTEMTIIDHFWGNPNAEIIGYICTDTGYCGKLDKEKLLKHVLEYWKTRKEYKSEHEIICFIKLYNVLPKDNKSEIIRQGISNGISSLLNMNIREWNTYVPRPLDFICEKNGEYFGITEEQIDAHLDFVVDEMNRQGIIMPNWHWGVYPQEWNIAKKEWTGVKTLEFLITADKFGRVQR